MLGDLVYCKEQESDKEMIIPILECEGDNGDDAHIDCHLEDISVTDLSEVKNASVKVLVLRVFLNQLFINVFI